MIDPFRSDFVEIRAGFPPLTSEPSILLFRGHWGKDSDLDMVLTDNAPLFNYGIKCALPNAHVEVTALKISEAA
jgi:hypothetical protein